MNQSLWVTIRQWCVNLYRAQRYYRLLRGIASCSTQCGCCRMHAELAVKSIGDGNE